MSSVINVVLLLIVVSLNAVLIRSNKITATKAGTTYGGVAKEIAKLAVFGRERIVIVVNRGSKHMRLWCASKDDSTGEKRVNPNGVVSFKFKPLVIGGHTVFWCTTDLNGFRARWDVFGSNARYGHKNENDRHYEFIVRNDGVHYKGRKIRGLDRGRHGYTLWDGWDKRTKRPFGTRLRGFVDGGMCNNIPGFMERKTSSVTICNSQCVILYSELHCRGQTSKLQGRSGCTNFFLSFFDNRARSVKGC